MGKQKDRRIKLNNHPKFVSFLNLNSKQTTKESLIVVSFGYFFSLLLRTLFFRSLSWLVYVSYFVPIPEQGRSINQLSNYAKYRHLSELPDLVDIQYTYVRYNYVYRLCGLTHICFENHLPSVCLSVCLHFE